jgi:hypothetical protein
MRQRGVQGQITFDVTWLEAEDREALAEAATRVVEASELTDEERSLARSFLEVHGRNLGREAGGESGVPNQ